MICSFLVFVQSWLRVSQQLHTTSQVAVGAALGFSFSVFWFWLWDAVILKVFLSHLWVQLIIVLGTAAVCVSFLLYVVRYWVLEANWFFVQWKSTNWNWRFLQVFDNNSRSDYWREITPNDLGNYWFWTFDLLLPQANLQGQKCRDSLKKCHISDIVKEWTRLSRTCTNKT